MYLEERLARRTGSNEFRAALEPGCLSLLLSLSLSSLLLLPFRCLLLHVFSPPVPLSPLFPSSPPLPGPPPLSSFRFYSLLSFPANPFPFLCTIFHPPFLSFLCSSSLLLLLPLIFCLLFLWHDRGMRQRNLLNAFACRRLTSREGISVDVCTVFVCVCVNARVCVSARVHVCVCVSLSLKPPLTQKERETQFDSKRHTHAHTHLSPHQTVSGGVVLTTLSVSHWGGNS